MPLWTVWTARCVCVCVCLCVCVSACACVCACECIMLSFLPSYYIGPFAAGPATIHFLPASCLACLGWSSGVVPVLLHACCV